MAQDGFTLKADAALTRDLAKAVSHEEISQLLSNATERSGIAYRNPDTGRFVRRDPLSPANQTVNPQEQEDKAFTKVVNIGGQDFEFTASSELELEQDIRSANEIAFAARTQAAQQAATASATPHVKTKAERERELGDRAELDLKFRRGELTTTEYLERTNAVGEYLASKGFDIEAAGAQQFEKSWADATQTFLHSPAGADWPGSQRNMEQIGLTIAALGLVDAQDKVGALAAAWAEMKRTDKVFATEPSEEQLLAETANMTPQEIIESWKQAQPDAERANQSFIDTFQNGRTSSSIFGR